MVSFVSGFSITDMMNDNVRDGATGREGSAKLRPTTGVCEMKSPFDPLCYTQTPKGSCSCNLALTLGMTTCRTVPSGFRRCQLPEESAS